MHIILYLSIYLGDFMSRCIACDIKMTNRDFQLDWDMCRHCLATIQKDLDVSSQLIDDDEEEVGDTDE